MRIPTIMYQWQHSWLNVKLSRNTSVVSTVTTYGNLSLFLISVDGILLRESLFLLAQ